MEYENPVYEAWCSAVRGMPLDYHRRFADRVIARLGDWVPQALVDIKDHHRQIASIYEEDLKRDRYDSPYLKLVEQWHRLDKEQTLNTS